jgi:hypothetical protein
VATTLFTRLRYPLGFALSQVLSLLPPALLLATVAWRAAPGTPVDGLARRYVTTITVAPCVVVVVGAIVAGRTLHAGWGFPFWSFLGTCVLAAWPPRIDVRRVGLLLAVWAGVLAVGAIGGASWQWTRVMVGREPGRPALAGDALAAAVSARWHAATDAPLAYVIGTQFPATNVGFFAADRPTVIAVNDLADLPWIDPEDLRRHGAAVVWEEEYGAEAPLHALVPLARGAGPAVRVEIPWHALGSTGSHAYRIAIVPPAP